MWPPSLADDLQDLRVCDRLLGDDSDIAHDSREFGNIPVLEFRVSRGKQRMQIQLGIVDLLPEVICLQNVRVQLAQAAENSLARFDQRALVGVQIALPSAAQMQASVQDPRRAARRSL